MRPSPGKALRFSLILSHNLALYLGDSLLKDIPTVLLSFDKHDPKNADLGGSWQLRSPLIMLHGLFGSKSNYRTIAKELALRLDRLVYCPDLRNFGQSPHAKRLDYPSLAADVEYFIEQQNFKSKPIILGHSMGAKTAMAVALRRPDLPRMLVSVDNAPVGAEYLGGSVFARYIRQLRIATEQYKYTKIGDVDLKLAEVEPNKEVRQFVLMNMNRNKADEPVTSKIPLEIIGRAIDAGNIALWPFDSNFTRWTGGPALFVRGTESAYVPDELVVEIGRFFPDFEVRDIKSGHWVISEKPQQFLDTLCEFIERHEEE